MIPLDTRKQGFTIPIIASLDYTYRLARAGGIPTSWIIEFSDPVIGKIEEGRERREERRGDGQRRRKRKRRDLKLTSPHIGNRWAPDEIRLQVDGRACPLITTSQHDRRWIYASEHDGFSVPGRGTTPLPSFSSLPISPPLPPFFPPQNICIIVRLARRLR